MSVDTIKLPNLEKIRMSVDTIKLPKYSNWTCLLFGCKSEYTGICYTPVEGEVPNWFIRWMMKICLGCTWIKNK